MQTLLHIRHALLVPAHAERLAGWPTYHHIEAIVVFRLDAQLLRMAGAFQVLVVGIGSPLVHLIAHAVEPRRLEAQRQPTTARKQIQHPVGRAGLRAELVVQLYDVGHR